MPGIYNRQDVRSNIANAVAANKEEMDLEAIVEVVGTGPAQKAAHNGTLPALVYTLSDVGGHA